MRKLIAVGVIVGGLLAGAGSAMASPPEGPVPWQGGFGDPLTLAASGVLIPYITTLGTVAVVEVASPVSDNPNLHMLFYDADCKRIGNSVGIPLTTNEIAFQDVGRVIGTGPSGLVAIADVAQGGFALQPIDVQHPIHTRVYEFSPVDGRSSVLEPIILDVAEAGFDDGWDGVHFWSPLRSAADFYAPLETAIVNTRLTLVCPGTNIQGAKGAAFGATRGSGSDVTPGTDTNFPQIWPPFNDVGTDNNMSARIYDTDERFLRDTTFKCNCLSNISVTALSNVYGLSPEAALGTYTEIERSRTVASSPFTGYRSVFTVGSPLNNFSGRLSNGNRDSLNGDLQFTSSDPKFFNR